MFLKGNVNYFWLFYRFDILIGSCWGVGIVDFGVFVLFGVVSFFGVGSFKVGVYMNNEYKLNF